MSTSSKLKARGEIPLPFRHFAQIGRPGQGPA